MILPARLCITFFFYWRLCCVHVCVSSVCRRVRADPSGSVSLQSTGRVGSGQRGTQNVRLRSRVTIKGALHQFHMARSMNWPWRDYYWARENSYIMSCGSGRALCLCDSEPACTIPGPECNWSKWNGIQPSVILAFTPVCLQLWHVFCEKSPVHFYSALLFVTWREKPFGRLHMYSTLVMHT